MTRRLLVLITSLVLALAGTGLVLAYVRSAEERAVADQSLVDVVVASSAIPAGMSLQQAQSEKLLQLRAMPRVAVPEGALTSVSDAGERVAANEISPGEVLLPGRLEDAHRAGALSIPEGKMAVSVLLSDPGRVAGFLVPGSEVAIFASDRLQKISATASVSNVSETSADVSVEAQKSDGATRLLLARVPVLAIGERSTDGTAGEGGEDVGEPVTTAVLTVAVTQAEAEKLLHAAWASEGGTRSGEGEETLAFALMTPASQTGPSDGTTDTNLFQ